MNSTGWSICRVCLETCEHDNFQSIFESDLNDNNDSTKIFIKICDCSGIIINENDQFNTICYSCIKDLKSAYNFRIRCQNSDKKLKENFKLEEQIDEKHIKDELINLLDTIKTDTFREIIDVGNVIENNVSDEIDSKSFKSEDLKSYANKINDSNKESKEPIKKTKRKYTKKDNTIPTTNEKKVKKMCEPKQKSGEKFPCEYCGHNYSDKITLRYHMRKHTNEMHYVCELCGTAFETNYKLTRHKMTHTGEKPYSCRFCDRTFLHSSNRNLHEKRLHTHIRNHQCEYCVKAFHTPCQLRKHIRVHTGEKPYICELCGTGFKAKSHLTAHMHSLVPCIVKMNLKNKIQNEK